MKDSSMPIALGVVTPAVAIANRTKNRFGIGEVLTLSVIVKPAQFNVGSFGGVLWRIAGGAGNALSAITPATGTATLTLGRTPGAVTLEAWSVTPPVKRLLRVGFTVVAPNGVNFTKVAGGTVAHVNNTASVGFIGQAEIEPMGVSFNNLQVREGSFHAKAGGAFAEHDGKNHEAGAWMTVTCNPATARNNWNAYDEVHSGTGAHRVDVHGVAILDQAGHHTFEPSTFEWSIPWHYRLVGSIEEGTIFVDMLHQQKVEMSGRVTIKKHTSESVSANLLDPTSTYGLPALGYP